jgi:beta-lactamase regulating signal transducer with metallopeptidase domain/Leucine-rich repeat (LRR) protein
MNAYASHIVSYLLAQSWQIALMAAIVGLISLALRNRSAHLRYLLWLIVLAKCLVPPVLMVPLAILPEPSSSLPLAVFDLPQEHSALEVPVLADTAPRPNKPARTVPSTREVVALMWVTGTFLFLLWVGGRAIRYTSWLRAGRRPLPPALQESIREAGFHFKVWPKIWLLEDISQPFVWGLLRGSVYLPADFAGLSSSDRPRNILAHELSHVARFDAGVNLLQVLAQAVYWFHPLVWWANRKIRQEREKCCDEMAVAHLHAPPEHYTGAIVETLAVERRSAHPIPSLAIVGSVRDIEERIKTMLKPGKTFRSRPSIVAATVALLVALVTIPTALVLTAKAQTPPTPAPQPAPSAARPEQRYPARTFNSTLPFNVFVQETTGLEYGPPLIGHTPSPTPLEIRGNVIWWVKPTAPVKDWKALLQEIEQSKVPGLMLVSVEDSDVQHLADFRSLKGLWLEGEKLTDAGLAPLEGLTGLQVLRLHKARIMGAGLAHIEGMTGLQVLMLDLTTNESLSHVKGLTQLQSLQVGFPATDAGLVYLKGLTELRRLGLYGTQVTDAGLVNLKGLSKLEVLNLSFTRITDAGITDLTALSSLSRLFLDGTAVTDAGLARLQTKTRLRRLNLDGNKITDTGLANLEPQNELNWLDLSGTQITDDGLAHLKGMSGMLRLHLSRTQITGTGLEHVKGLPRLWQLDLSETRMTDAGLAHLEGMTQLRDLNLSRTQITDPGLVHLKGLTGLQRLDLSGTQVTEAGVQQLKQSLPNVSAIRNLPQFPGVPAANAQMPAPTKPVVQPAVDTDKPGQPCYTARTFNSSVAFDVTFCEMSKSRAQRIGRTPSPTPIEIPACWLWLVQPVAPVEDWDAVIKEVSRNHVPGLVLQRATDADLERLAGLGGLEFLVLNDARITDDGLTALKGLTALWGLSLCDAKITGAGLEHLQDLAGLRWLDLSHAGVTDAGLQGLEGLRQLRRLNLMMTQVTDAGLEHLKGLTELQVLSLSQTEITDAGLVHLRGLIGLRDLDLAGTQITDTGLAPLQYLTGLQALDLSATGITDAGLAYLKSLTGLRDLKLGAVQITDAGLVHLRGLTGLQKLSLYKAQITDAGLEYLKGLTGLQYVHLQATQVTDAGLEYLKGLTGLEYLNVYGTQVTRASAARLKESLPKLSDEGFPPDWTLGRR